MRLARDDPWASYGRTVVQILQPGGGSIRVRAARDPDEASWPWPTRAPVHVLTAWDPGLERPARHVNRARQDALEADLRRLEVPMLAAIGEDPVTGRREEGVLIRGLPEPQVLTLAARYGQDAVFAWTPPEWAIVACDGGRRLVSGWTLVPPTSGA